MKLNLLIGVGLIMAYCWCQPLTSSVVSVNGGGGGLERITALTSSRFTALKSVRQELHLQKAKE